MVIRCESATKIRAILFDFGGVLAEEGFREGLKAIARSKGIAPDTFFESASAAVYRSGYVVGAADEHSFWNMVREITGINDSDSSLKNEIIKRFILRPWMMDIVRNLREKGFLVGILSDQTQWLDELNQKYDFFKEFDVIFNSYHIGRGKHDSKTFTYVSESIGLAPEEIVFVDDNLGHIERARSIGMKAILFVNKDSFIRDLMQLGLIE